MNAEHYDSKPVTICALITCHNRRSLTVTCIDALFAAVPQAVILNVILVDAGSTDGTAESVLAANPSVTIVRTGPDVYWCRGMREAWVTALSSKPDFYLWINDDLAVFPTAIGNLMESYNRYAVKYDGRVLIVGKTMSPTTGKVSYGGYKVSPGMSRIRFRRLSDDETECDTMNGNCVLIPARAVDDIGMMSERYTHALGDHDYAQRAVRGGYHIIQCDSPVGEQEENDQLYSGNKVLFSWRLAHYLFTHPKGLPWWEWLYFCRTFAGPMWPVNFVFRYIKLFSKLRTRSHPHS